MGWNGPENGHMTLERTSIPVSNLERLSKSENTFRNRPESVANVLRSDPSMTELTTNVFGNETASEITGKAPEKNPDTLSQDPFVKEVQSDVYKALGIDIRTDSNGLVKKFSKGVIDGLLVGNAELAMQIKNEGIEKFLSQVKDQITSLEGWRKIAESLGKSVMELFSWDPYKTGKSVADLGLITTWAGLAGVGLKKIGKEAIILSGKIWAQTVTKDAVSSTLYAVWRTSETIWKELQKPAKVIGKVAEYAGKGVAIASEKIGVTKAIKKWTETIRESIGSSEIIRSVKGKVDKVLENRQMARAEKLEAEGKLVDSKRLDLEHYDTPEKLNALKSRLWLPESATIDQIDKVFRLRLHDAMEQYEKLWKQNLERIGRDFIYEMRKQGEKNPKEAIIKEMSAVREAYEKGDIFIARVHMREPDAITGKPILSPYQLDEKPFSRKKVYGQIREWVDQGIWIHGLDPKYSAFLVNKNDVDALTKAYDAKSVSRISMDDLRGKSWVTFYDSILFGKTEIAGIEQYMMGIDDVFTAQALKNIENTYNIGNFKAMQQEALSGMKPWKLHDMYENMPNFVEIQMFWRILLHLRGSTPYKKLKTYFLNHIWIWTLQSNQNSFREIKNRTSPTPSKMGFL